MKKNKRSFSIGSLGTGYASIIMMFVIITLTVLSALSFSAAGVNSGQDERSFGNMKAYYSAETSANEKLMRLDEAAHKAAESGLFMTFETDASMIGGVTVTKSPEGYSASWTEEISDKVSLSCAVTFFSEPELHGNKRYEITEWNTVSGGAADTHINVWDGTF